MEVTTLSTKGQIVIPEKIRKNYSSGNVFVVTKVGELIVLKPIKGLTEKEKKELKELNKIWSEIEKNTEVYSEEEFFKELKKW